MNLYMKLQVQITFEPFKILESNVSLRKQNFSADKSKFSLRKKNFQTFHKKKLIAQKEWSNLMVIALIAYFCVIAQKEIYPPRFIWLLFAKYDCANFLLLGYAPLWCLNIIKVKNITFVIEEDCHFSLESEIKSMVDRSQNKQKILA